MESSRSVKSALNMLTGFASKGLTYITRFVLRTVFIYTLSTEYLGVSSVFSGILTLLSLTDLGFSIALPFSLYKPLAEKDTDRINTIMRYYAKVYICLGCVVVGLGLALVPLLPYLIEETSISNITEIYILYVLQTAVSYFFIYRKTLIVADQKSYIVTSIDCIGQLITCAVQVVVLLVFKSFEGYLLAGIFGILGSNIAISRKCTQLYPYLKEKTNNRLKKEERRDMTKSIGALAVYKIAIAVESSISSILVARILGLQVAGIWSNYQLISFSLMGVLQIGLNSLTASIGNLINDADNAYTYKMYRILNGVSFWVYGVVSVCFVNLLQPFIRDIWLDKTFLLDDFAAIMMVLSFYVCGTQDMNGNFRNAYGLFWEGRYRPVIMVILQIVLGALFTYFWGIAGLYIGIAVSRLLSVGILDPYIVHKYGLHKNPTRYYLMYMLYLVLAVMTGTVLYFAYSWIPANSLVMWGLKGIVLFVSANLIYFVVCYKTDTCVYIRAKARNILTKAKRK